MYNIAVILAGGTGSRVGGETPKQFLPIKDGRSVLEHAVDAFEASPAINEIAVVMHPDHIDALQELCRKNSWRKLAKIIPGGTERWESSWHAILAYADFSPAANEKGEPALFFHDAARPFVSQRIIAGVAEALETHEAVTVAVPVTDTLYLVESGKVAAVPERAKYMCAQTPQAFHYNLVFNAFAKAIASEQIIATDDVGIVRKFEPGKQIFIVVGEEENRKITYKEDL